MSLIAAGMWRAHPDEPAIIDQTGAVSWREVDSEVNGVCHALAHADLGVDRRVAVFAENSRTTVLAYLGAILSGCSGVPINSRLRPDECAYILQDSHASLLFVGPENVDAGLDAARIAGGMPVVAWDVESQPGLITWDEFCAMGRDSEPSPDIRPLPYLHYTSGTTGFPKGTLTPPGVYPGSELPTMREHVDALVAARPADARPRLVAGPLYYSGQLASIKRSLLAGSLLVVLERFDPERFLEAVAEHQVASTLLVPTHLNRLLALPEETRAQFDTSSLQQLWHGGAPCPPDVKRRVIKWFGPIVWESYGATEQGIISVISSEEWLEHPGSVGRVRAGLELYVISEDGRRLGVNEVGRLYFRDASGFDVRFQGDQAKTDSVHLEPGVFTIGEVGHIDDDGYLYIADRFSDQIVSGGVNIFPAEAEQVMASLPGVDDVACIGVPHADLGEMLLALIVPCHWDTPPSVSDIIDRTQQRLSKFKCPREVAFVTDLGRTPAGKVNKRELRDRYLRGALETLAGAPVAAE